jgi:hypothetical protein
MIANRALENFATNLRAIEQLVRFDDRLIEMVLAPLERHRERLVRAEITNTRLLPDPLIATLRNIKRSESLKTYYRALYNQWLVLLVSYFGSAVRDLFVDATADAIRRRTRDVVLKESIKAPIEELAEEHDDPASFLADLLAGSEGMSFQDMQSIGRAFGRYFDADVPRDDVVNDVILAQACRHAIVHAGGLVDRKMLRQLRDAQPRTLKPKLTLNESLSFEPSEIDRAAEAMRAYLARLAVAIT